MDKRVKSTYFFVLYKGRMSYNKEDLEYIYKYLLNDKLIRAVGLTTNINNAGYTTTPFECYTYTV